MSINRHTLEIESSLRTLRARIRRVQVARAGLIVATALLGGLAIMMAADHCFSPLPLSVRWLMFGSWILGGLVALYRGLTPLRKTISLVQLARWLEVRHPEIEERLSTVLELQATESGVSPSLLAALTTAANADADKVDAKLEVTTTRTTQPWARPLIGLALLMLLTFGVWPHEIARLLVRAVTPFSDLGNAGAGRFTILPGNLELLEDDRLELTAAYDGPESTAELWLDFEDGRKISQTLSKIDGAFHDVLTPMKHSFRYHLLAGPNESDAFTATVWPLPMMMKSRATLEFPDYTAAPKQDTALDHSLQAVVGTKVTLTAQLNTAIESAWLEINGITLAVDRTGDRMSLSWTLTKPGTEEAVVKLKHRLGREVAALHFTIETLADQPPTVVLLSPSQTELTVRPDEQLSMRYEVTEDFSVSKVTVEVEAGSSPTFLQQPLPTRSDRSKPPRFKGTADLAVGALLTQFPGTHELRLRIRAEDARPTEFGGAGVGTSEWLNIHIDESAESLARQLLHEEHEGARDEIQMAIQTIQKARDQMVSHRDEMKNEQLGEPAKKHFEEAGEKLAATRESLDGLSKRMEESIHASKAGEVKKASDLLQKMRENLENSTAQDQAEQRESKLDEAHNEAEEALKQLEAVRNDMARQKGQIEDLARMEDLAQQQRELARQAEADLQKQATLPPDWKQRQEQAKEAMRQQIQQRPDARAQAAKTQADQARELARKARILADNQTELKEQIQQATNQSPAAQKTALQHAIAAEQNKIAEQAEAELTEARRQQSPAADRLPKAATAAVKAHDQILQGDPKSASQSAKESALAMLDATEQTDLSNGNSSAADHQNLTQQSAQKHILQQLSERQTQIAEAMAALANGDSTQALQQLQESRAQDTREFSEAVTTAPQAESPAAMQDSRSAAKQGSDQAQSAAQQTAKPQQAAIQHQQAAQSLQNSAESLAIAAQQMDQSARQSAIQQADPEQAPVSAENLSQAFQKASEAANAKQPAAAAAQAADALSSAAQSARRSLQGKSSVKPAKPGGKPGAEPGQQGRTGINPNAEDPSPEADPGVPPELTKLGISAQDWEKIQTSLQSDVGATDHEAIPEEYRTLVKDYFESMSKKTLGN
jgi:hypothetical protein